MGDHIEILETPKIVKDPFIVRFAKFMLPIVIAIGVAMLIRMFIAEPIRVSGASMENTYHNGQFVLLEKVSYRFRSPACGDVVVCHYPDEYYEGSGRPSNSWCVKRIVGVAGDKLQTKNGLLYRNGELVDEPYLNGNTYTTGIEDEYVVPDGCVYVLGDNREVSSDSRDYRVGPIKLEDVKGKLLW